MHTYIHVRIYHMKAILYYYARLKAVGIKHNFTCIIVKNMHTLTELIYCDISKNCPLIFQQGH